MRIAARHRSCEGRPACTVQLTRPVPVSDDAAATVRGTPDATRGQGMHARTEIARSTTRTHALVQAREYFGGIWFKIFSERGPSRPTRTL